LKDSTIERQERMNTKHLPIWILAAACGGLISASAQVPFTIQGPNVNPAQFRITTFATGINYVLGMEQLSDGSILAAISDGPNYFSSNGRLVRFVDANHDGVADGPGATLATGLPGGLTSVRIAGNLVFVTGQKKPITVLRLGATPSAALTVVGTINLNYPSGSWLHPHSALGIRPTPNTPQSVDLLFQLGSRENFATTPDSATVTLSSPQIAGANGTLKGDSFYKITFTDNGTAVTASGLTQLANGLRNPAGFAFQPSSGDLYFQDNGIDGLVDANEPLSADELNVIPAAEIGGVVEFFGFPTNYIEYRTGRVVGGAGVAPLVAFQPLPNPINGEESEGSSDIAFAPPGFPDGLNNGMFVTFHGKFSLAGTQNEENALVYVDLPGSSYFHFIPSATPGVGHLDGLLSTTDSLYVSDLSKNGAYSTTGAGVIYQIKSLVGPALHFQWNNGRVELTWSHGALERATALGDAWTEVAVAPGPYIPQPADTPQFFRTRN
jgi:glucose/arabinose dehydrogenase